MHRRNNPYARLNQDVGQRGYQQGGHGSSSSSPLSRCITFSFVLTTLFLSGYTYKQSQHFAHKLEESHQTYQQQLQQISQQGQLASDEKSKLLEAQTQALRDNHAGEVQRLKSNLDASKETIETLEQNKTDLRSQVSDVEQKQHNQELSVELLEKQMDEQSELVKQRDATLVEKENAIHTLTTKLEEATQLLVEADAKAAAASVTTAISSATSLFVAPPPTAPPGVTSGTVYEVSSKPKNDSTVPAKETTAPMGTGAAAMDNNEEESNHEKDDNHEEDKGEGDQHDSIVGGDQDEISPPSSDNPNGISSKNVVAGQRKPPTEVIPSEDASKNNREAADSNDADGDVDVTAMDNSLVDKGMFGRVNNKHSNDEGSAHDKDGAEAVAYADTQVDANADPNTDSDTDANESEGSRKPKLLSGSGKGPRDNAAASEDNSNKVENGDESQDANEVGDGESTTAFFAKMANKKTSEDADAGANDGAEGIESSVNSNRNSDTDEDTGTGIGTTVHGGGVVLPMTDTKSKSKASKANEKVKQKKLRRTARNASGPNNNDSDENVKADVDANKIDAEVNGNFNISPTTPTDANDEDKNGGDANIESDGDEDQEKTILDSNADENGDAISDENAEEDANATTADQRENDSGEDDKSTGKGTNASKGRGLVSPPREEEKIVGQKTVKTFNKPRRAKRRENDKQ
jgi:hypothetical protein